MRPLYVHILQRRVDTTRFPVRAYELRRLGGGLRWTPPTDVFETQAGGLVRVEAAGMSAGEFEVTLHGQRLVVSGTRREPPSEARRTCHQKEIASGHFHVEVEIAWPIEPDQVEARYEDGYLVVTLPRPDVSAPGGAV